MKDKTRIISTVASCLVLFTGIVFYFMTGGPETADQKGKSLSRQTLAMDGDGEGMPDYDRNGAAFFSGAQGPDSFVATAVARLQKDFGKGPLSKSAQMQLAGLRNYLSRFFPGTFQAVFRDIIGKAFPAQAAEILKTLEGLDTYNAWLEANKDRLSKLGHDAIKQELWARRTALFGKDAKAMWAEETRTEAVADVLDIMRDAYDTTIPDKMELYLHAINRISKSSPSGSSGETFIEDKKISLTRAFLSLDSVQSELADMDGEKRAETLRSIRKTMGFSESELDALAKKDTVNEGKWQTGYAYMNERNQLLSEPDDGSRDEKLLALQERYFKNAASTIKAEEASGFFRFNRPRVYGRN